MLLEFKTYRYRGHSMADPGKYRTKEEVEEWKKKDPLELVKLKIERFFPNQLGEIKRLTDEVEEEIQDAVRFAHDSPEPDPGEVERFTYIEENPKNMFF